MLISPDTGTVQNAHNPISAFPIQGTVPSVVHVTSPDTTQIACLLPRGVAIQNAHYPILAFPIPGAVPSEVN